MRTTNHRLLLNRLMLLLLSILLASCNDRAADNAEHSTANHVNTPTNPSSGSNNSGSQVIIEPTLILAINAGAFAPATFQQIEYQADRFFVGGSLSSTNDPIAGTDEDALFQSERYGNFSYEVPVTEATYAVTLHFVEMYWEASGKRTFNVMIEGQATDLAALDIYREVGHDSRYSYTIENVQVSDGHLSIAIESLTEKGTVSGLAIYSIDGAYIEPPPATAPLPPEPEPASPENLGADCELVALPTALSALGQNALLPDPFKKLDGTRLSNHAEWRCHRQEILRQAEATIYGTKPPKPDRVTGTLNTDTIAVNVAHQGKTTSFTASISLPEGKGPFPAMILVLPWAGANAQTEIIRSEGVAVITLNPYAIGNEQSQRHQKAGAFYDIYGEDSSTGLLVAWAWGASRLLDVLEQVDGTLINPAAIGVTGCSRFGKGAFTIGAFDQRIALTVPFESGSGGVPIWRGIPGEGAQSPISAYGETYWLGDAFAPFTSNVNTLPIDTHHVIGMIAPRGLFIMDNPHITHLGPKSAQVAALAGAEIYKALGAENHLTYHANVASADHCAMRPEHEQPLREHIRKFLKAENAATGGISTHPSITSTLNEWIDWTTPVLRE